MTLCPSVPLRAQLCPPYRETQEKVGALFKNFPAPPEEMCPLTFETVSAPLPAPWP